MNRKILPFVAAVVWAALTPAFAAENASKNAPDKSSNPAPKTLKVLTYSSFNSSWGPGPKIKAAFEKTCHCTLQWSSTEDSVMLLRRLQLEGQALDADVLLGLDNQTIAQAEATGQVAPLTQPLKTRFGETHDVVPFDFGYLAFIKRKKDDLGPLDSLEALASSQAPLRIALEDPRTSTVGASLLPWVALNTADPKAFWQGIKPKLQSVSQSWSQAYNLFLNGTANVVLSYTTSPIYHQIVENNHDYEALLFKKPHYEQIEYAFALKHAKNPALAQQFLAFLLKPETQKTIALNNWMYPVIEGVDLPKAFTDAPRPQGENLPPKTVAKDWPQWLATWKTVLLTPQ